MRKEKSRQTPQKYKKLLENTMKIYMLTTGKPRKNGQLSRKIQTAKTDQGRNRKFKRTIISKEIESVIKKTTQEQKPWARWIQP